MKYNKIDVKKIFLIDEWNWVLRDSNYNFFDNSLHSVRISSQISFKDDFELIKAFFILRKLNPLGNFKNFFFQKKTKKGMFKKTAQINSIISKKYTYKFNQIFFSKLFQVSRQKNFGLGVNLLDFNVHFIFSNLGEYSLFSSKIFEIFYWPYNLEITFTFGRFSRILLSTLGFKLKN